MRCSNISFTILAVFLGTYQSGFAQELKSGPQVGEKITPFNPLNAVIGEKDDIVEAFGRNPTVLIFAKEADAGFVSLVRELDARAAKANKARPRRLNVAAILTTDDENGKAKLLNLREKYKIDNVTLAIDNPSGPRGYKLAREAQVTVLLCEDLTVRVNYAFEKGKLDEKAIFKILLDIPKTTKPAQKRP